MNNTANKTERAARIGWTMAALNREYARIESERPAHVTVDAPVVDIDSIVLPGFDAYGRQVRRGRK